MDHLGTLRSANLVMAVLVGLVGALFAGIWGIGGILAIRDGEPMGWLFLIGAILFGALFGVFSWAHGRVARRVGEGRGRIPQTALAIFHLASFPLGTLYGIYALWVCWMNEATKTVFDARDGRL
jgi:hypothetical protein